VQLRGSCPLFWTQFPIGIPSPSIRLGPSDEGLRRFTLHFDALERVYGHRILVVSLTSPGRREGAMTETYQLFLQDRNLDFRWLPFVSHMNTPGGIETKVAELTDSLEWLEVEKGRIVSSQTAFVRTNCMSSLDRTGVFQFFLSGQVMKRFAKLTTARAEMWRNQANELAMAYAGACGQKLVVPFAGQQTTWGEFCDYANRGRRFVNSLLFEGRMDDAYAVVCQERNISETRRRNIIVWFLVFLTFLLGALLTLVFKGAAQAGGSGGRESRRSFPIRDTETSATLTMMAIAPGKQVCNTIIIKLIKHFFLVISSVSARKRWTQRSLRVPVDRNTPINFRESTHSELFFCQPHRRLSSGLGWQSVFRENTHN
jgi:hypothetical protein